MAIMEDMVPGVIENISLLKANTQDSLNSY
jgi:hypothetical protein